MSALCGVCPRQGNVFLIFAAGRKTVKNRKVYCIHFLAPDDMRQFQGGSYWNVASGSDSMWQFLARDARVWASRSPKRPSRRLWRRRAESKPVRATREGFTRTGRRVTIRCALIAPSWLGAPGELGAAAHPRCVLCTTLSSVNRHMNTGMASHTAQHITYLSTEKSAEIRCVCVYRVEIHTPR